ncbi:hypothetical protein [Nonomuraea sp. NPDC049625]
MDNVGIVVDEGRWAARLDDHRVDVAMMRTPDGHGRIVPAK